MASFGATIRGIPEYERALQQFGVRAIDALAVGLREIGEGVMLQAKELCPVLTGNLRASGVVQEPVRTPDAIELTLSFGDTAVDYAIYVHENLEARHPNGQAKFLEQPLVEMEPNMPNLLADSQRAQPRC